MNAVMMPEIVDQATPLVLVHPGGFDGFLSAVCEALRLNLPVDRIESVQGYEPGLFESTRSVETDTDLAHRAAARILWLCGEDIVSMIRAALLSELPGIQSVVWRVLRGLLRDGIAGRGRNILDADTHATLAAAEKTRHEAHRFRGFVRFSKAPDGSLFSVIAPDHDILELLAPHFSARFPNETWMIADAKRGRCLRHAKGELEILSVDTASLPKESKAVESLASMTDRGFQELWQTYYKSINIAERANPKLLARNLPRKYWRYLPERAVSLRGH
ncbi:MAG: TIGR03915 family putative DNA repair protein [Fibrobacteres bacterium]|nr:TIGR03915 family putative DNA repair protein [Fibrobacterota bacterium]